jgi:hemerythrin-like domain-containing protein
MNKATANLREDHEAIKAIMNILEKIVHGLANGKPINSEHVDEIIDFIKGFADFNHHGKEEAMLFPSLVEKGFQKDSGPIGVMLHEHAVGRNYIAALDLSLAKFKNGDLNASKDVVSNALEYIALLRNHIDKENGILFTMADNALDDREQNLLYDAFIKHEKEVVGIERHAKYYETLKKLEAIYNY